MSHESEIFGGFCLRTLSIRLSDICGIASNEKPSRGLVNGLLCFSISLSSAFTFLMKDNLVPTFFSTGDVAQLTKIAAV